MNGTKMRNRQIYYATQKTASSQLSGTLSHDLRKKYPALQDAYNHYQNIKQMCETREKEEDAS